MNAQKRKHLGFTQAPTSPQKVCDENERNKQRRKNDTRKNVIDGGKPFVRSTQRTGEKNLIELR